MLHEGDFEVNGTPCAVIGKRPVGLNLARYRLFQISAQICEDLLVALLDLEQDRLRHASIVRPRMDLAGLQADSAQVCDALLCDQHLVVGLNHGNSSSTIPRWPARNRRPLGPGRGGHRLQSLRPRSEECRDLSKSTCWEPSSTTSTASQSEYLSGSNRCMVRAKMTGAYPARFAL